MKKIRYLLTVLAMASVVFYACDSSDSNINPTGGDNGSSDDDEEVSGDTNEEESDDYTFDSDTTFIVLNGTEISVDGSGVTVNSNVAAITDAGTYNVTGSLSDGQLVVEASSSDKVKIQLDDADLVSSANASLYLKSAEKVILYLVPDTENTITDGNNNEYDGSLHSITELSIYGTGSLEVTGNAEDGIYSESGIIIKESNITVTSAESAIKSEANIIINSGTFKLTAGNDGIHGENVLTINDGDILITQCEEGLESSIITLNGGNIELTSNDDGINASSDDDGSNNYIYINGGYLYINAEGDGIDSNGYVEMTDGVVIVDGPTGSDNGAIDYDKSFSMTGGFLLAVGSSRMVQTPSQSSSTNTVSITYRSSKQANNLVHIEDADGNNLVTFSPSKKYQSVVFSDESLVTGSSYKAYSGGSSTGTATNGLYEDGTYTAGTLTSSFTVSGTITSINGD